MTLLAPSAPLLAVAHDWSSPVERVTTYPSRVLTKWDGTEQRLSLSHLPVERITYRLIAPASTDAVALTTLPDLAADALVRVPRWENQTRVDTAVSAGAVDIPCDTSDRGFVVDQEVLLWRSPTEYEVGVVDVISSSNLRVYDSLVSGWGAGTIVVPISEARLVLPFGVSHWRPTSGAPEITVDLSVRDLAGLGTGGTASAGVPSAISVTTPGMKVGGRTYCVARVTDAAGNVLVRNDIVWTSSEAVDCPVYTAGDPQMCTVTNPASAYHFSFTVTATIGAVSGSATVFMGL